MADEALKTLCAFDFLHAWHLTYVVKISNRLVVLLLLLSLLVKPIILNLILVISQII